MRLSPGRWLNAQMHLLSWLGEDLHGESFRAEQSPQGRSVVVRILHAEACRTSAYIERFRRVAERAMLLSHRHTAVVHALGILPGPSPGSSDSGYAPAGDYGAGRGESGGSSGGTPWIATDPIEGPDLRSYLAEGLSPAALAPLLLPVADLLDRAAALGLCHGELAPTNLILVSEPQSVPRLVLLDLGLAKVLATDLLELPAPPGMLHYKSPEQCKDGLSVVAASDRYALATILFEAVAGRPPFVSDQPRALMQLHRTAPVPPLRTLVPRLPRAEALDTFFVRALAKDPEARFSSAVAMMEEFMTALGLKRQGLGSEPQRRRSPRWYRLFRQGDAAATAIDVVVGPRAVLGKQSECDVVCLAMPSPENDLITAAISREHAVLIWLDNRLSVLDQSSHGTFVNDRRIGVRLTALPDEAQVRLGEHVTVQVTPLPERAATSTGQPPSDATGALLTRRDAYAVGVPPTLMLWQQLQLSDSPLRQLGGAMRLGQVWVAQRELWWSGHPTVVWQRQDRTTVLGPAPLRGGDTLTTCDSVICIDH